MIKKILLIVFISVIGLLSHRVVGLTQEAEVVKVPVAQAEVPAEPVSITTVQAESVSQPARETMQETAVEAKEVNEPQQKTPSEEAKPQKEEVKKEVQSQEKEANITLDFKDADIQNVLRVLAYKSGVNIVAGKEVIGTVTIRLVEVPWEQALAVILNTYGFAYEREGNVITVSTVEVLKERREKKRELTEIESVTSRVFNLQFLDASDAKRMLEPQLSPQGKISVLEITGQKGWVFGAVKAGEATDESGKERREREGARSRALVVTDTPTYLDRLEKILKDIDLKPNQVLIEARIMEVSRDTLKDLGFEFATGTRLETHGTDRAQGMANVGSGHHAGNITSRVYSESDAGTFTPSNFTPKATGLTAANAGFELLFKRLLGRQFEVMVHALEEDVRTNTLSAPRVLTLSGQEAVIMVGEKYPILETDMSGTSGNATTTLDYYQDIGVQLYVVPQITGDEKFVNMIIHPVVSASNGVIGANQYPRLLVREAETQILMEDGETIVIGGLLKDVKSKGKIGIPLLSDIPIIGSIFTRRTNDVEKIDLLIFITARVIRPGELTEQEIAMVKEALEAGQPNVSPGDEEKVDKKEDKKANKRESKKEKSAKKKERQLKAEGYTEGNKGYLKRQ